MYDSYEPPVTAEDVLDGEELRSYREAKTLRWHSVSCRNPECSVCCPPAEDEYSRHSRFFLAMEEEALTEDEVES